MTGKDGLLRTHYEPGVVYTLLCFVPLPMLKKELVALTEKKKFKVRKSKQFASGCTAGR